MVLYADGGGRAKAALNPIYGSDRVVRFLLGIARKAPEHSYMVRLANVNGEPGLVFTLNGATTAIVTIDLDEDDRIRGFFWVVNPEKLPITFGI